MPLDSLGLGLTLDTTLLEKADKTLENMHKNSKLIMQNLTRGISAFDDGKINNFSSTIKHISDSLDKISKTSVSPDFDTRGLAKGVGYVTELVSEIEKMQKAGTKQFFNTDALYTTKVSVTETAMALKNLRDEADRVDTAIRVFLQFPDLIDASKKRVQELRDELKSINKKQNPEQYAATTVELDVERKKLQGLKDTLAEVKKEYGNLNNARLKSKQIIEQIAIAEDLHSWTSKTKAEQLAAITSYNNKIIAEERARTKEVETLYKNNFAEMQKISKSIAQLEADREKIAKGGGDTTEQDMNLAFYRDQLQKRIELEEEITKSGYQKIAKIKEELDAKSFLNTSKQQVKDLQTDLAYANQFSKNAKNINEEKEAIEILTAARDNLSQNTAHYGQIVAALNKRILSHKDHIEAVTRVEKEQNTLADSVINRYRKQLKALDEVNKALEKQMKIERKTSVADLDPTNADTQALLARQKTIADDIAAIEKQAQGELDVIKEQHEAERAKKRIDETIKTNEREKQEYAKLLDEKYALEKQKRAMEAAGAKVGDKSYDYMLAQEKELDKKILQLEQKHQGDIAEIHLKHLDKKNQDEVREFIATQKEKQRIAEEYAKKQREKAKKYGTISSASADRLIGVTENAKNINQHKAAIEKLTQAKSSLDNTDKNYFVTLKKIDKALRQHHKALREAGVESNNLMQSHRGLLNIGGQLARRLALAFSVSQLTQYFRKLVEVRGQFEKTEVALTSIIGDNQKAQKLMNQTIALAIKSPFTLQQLTGYTKQLAAYQVSYEELHSTTKMLADVSAGLGVEMDRLILAFGQVKAANYLRATEVRQFTEAGFNILGELAKYYGEIEDRMISVGEVQEMVTKRMVDFEDVAEVFKRVTQEGGRFYEMQSKQAETLAGQWTNLQDRIDVMLNEIGTDREGLLKGLVRMLASLIDNWEAIADVLKIVVGAFVLYKMNLLAVTKSQIANNLATQESIKLKIKEALAAKSLAPIYKNLSSSMRGFGSSMKVFGKANLWVAALTAVIGSITAIVKHVQKMKEVLAEQDKIFNENTASLLKLSEQYKKASKGADAYNSKIKVLQELSDKLEDRNLTLSVKIEDVDENNIDKIFEENSERLQKAYEFGRELGKAITEGMNEAQGNVFGFSFFGENLKEDAEDYGKSMGKLMSWGMQAQMKNIENSARVNYSQMGKYAKEYYNSIKDGKRANESEYEWTKRRATALVMISKLEGDIVGKNKELQKTLRNVVADGIELHHETKGVYDNLVESAGGLKNLRKEVASNPIEMAAQIKTEVDKLDYDPATKQFIINDLYAMLHLKVNYVEDPNATPTYDWSGFKKDLKESREDLKKFVDENNKSLGYENFFFSEDEIKKLEEFSDALEAIQKKYDENKKNIERLDGTAGDYNKEELARLNALQKELEAVAKKWGYNLNANSKGNSASQKILNDRISLVKELNKKYEELNKTFDENTSKQKVIDAYSDTFKKAFEGTGIDLPTLIIDKEKLDELQKTGQEAGKVFSDAMLSEMNKMAEEGAYIRDFTEDAINFIKENEGKPILTAKDVEKKGLGYTIGYGEYQKYKDTGKVIQKGDTITEEEALRRLTEIILPQFKKELNGVLDANKDLIFTQEQYNALLDLSFQGGVGKVKDLIKYSQDEAEGLKHITEIQEKVNEVFGEEQAARFGEAFINKFKEAESVYDRMALLFETMNLTIAGGKISEDLYEGMQKRSDKRAALFSGDLEVIKLLEKSAIDVSQIDFTNLEGVVAILKKLKPLAKKEGKEAEQALSRAISQVEAEIGVKIKEKEDEKLNDEIQSLFDRYDLSLELKKLNIPQDLAKSLFDVDYLDLDGLKKAVQEQESKFIGTDMEEEYKKFLDKISGLQRKQSENEAKEFINFLKKNLNEIQIIQDKGAYNISLADRLFGQGKITAEQYMSSIRQIVEETNKETSRVSLENFKESPKYIQAMGDMTAYTADEVRRLIKELESVVAANSAAFSADEAKAYIDAIYNAQEKLDELEQSPFRWESFAKIGEILKTDKDINDQKKERNMLQEQEKAQLEELVRLEEKLKRLQEDKRAILSGEGDLKSKADRLAPVQSDIDATTQAIKTSQQAVAATQSQAKTTETILGKLGDKMKGLTGKGGGAASTVAIIDAIINGINDTVQGVLDITNEIGSVMESFGKETDMSTGFGKFQKGFAIFAESSQHAADGWNALKSGDPVGAVVSVVKSVTSLIRGINEYKDAELQVEIDKQAEQVERLGKAYEKLEQSTERAYSIEQLQKVNAELERNIELQIASYKAMIAAENAKKNTDTEQIEAWNDELEALTQQWEDLKDSLLEGLGGVAESSFRSQTREFVDSWVSAFKETGNGLNGLQENFRDFFDNIIAEQAALRVTEKFLAPFYESLNTALDDLKLSVGESKNLREEADKIMPELSKALELIWSELGGSRGEVGGDGLSGLQKGISGMSEQQAEILTAYWNSVRGYTASIDSKMDLILANMGVGAENNPMLEQLISQTSWLSKIHNILDGLTTSSSGVVGRRIKVTM